jgi:hypothetical protein
MSVFDDKKWLSASLGTRIAEENFRRREKDLNPSGGEVTAVFLVQ